MKTCQYCGRLVDDNVQSCDGCGGQVFIPSPIAQQPYQYTQPEQNPYYQASQYQQPQKKKTGCIIAIAIPVGLLLLFFLFIMIIPSPSNSTQEDKSNSTPQNNTTQEETTIDSTLGQYKVDIVKWEIVNPNGDGEILVVTYSFTNNSESAQSFAWSITDKAFQNGIQIEDPEYLFEQDFYDSDSAGKDIKPGVTFNVQKIYRLDSLTAPVEIELSESFSFSDKTIYKTIDITQ